MTPQKGHLAGIAAILRHRRLRTRGLELLRLAIGEFFVPQFETRLFPGARRVVSLEHSLDARIPFVPSRVRIYLSFIRGWLQSLGDLRACLGEAALPDIEASIRDLCRLYRAAGGIYRRCQTTTARPAGPLLSPHFLLIRLFDPHLHCVPSLHVLIACYTYMQVRHAFRARCGMANAPAAIDAYNRALEVVRAILLVKQHSLSDIGPSLFVLSALFPQYERRQAERFVRDLFHRLPGVPSAILEKMRRAVIADYLELLRQATELPEVGWEELLLGRINRGRLGPS